MSDSYALTLRQQTPPTPGQPEKQPLPIPLSIGLVGPNGEDIPLIGPDGNPLDRPVITLEKAEQTFVFENVPVEPAPSLNRGFSAPIRLDLRIGDEERAFLAANDTDPFNRWEAMQQLASQALLARVENADEPWPPALLDAIAGTVLADAPSPPSAPRF